MRIKHRNNRGSVLVHVLPAACTAQHPRPALNKAPEQNDDLASKMPSFAFKNTYCQPDAAPPAALCVGRRAEKNGDSTFRSVILNTNSIILNTNSMILNTKFTSSPAVSATCPPPPAANCTTNGRSFNRKSSFFRGNSPFPLHFQSKIEGESGRLMCNTQQDRAQRFCETWSI